VTDRDVQHAAEFLAARGVLLLGLGILTALASLAVVLVVVGVLRRYRSTVGRAFAVVVRSARGIEVVDRSIARTRALVPSGYLAVHLMLGLVLTAAASVFVVIAEDIVGGGELAAFDVAFAQALRHTATPEWERVFGVVSWLGEREAIAVATIAVGGRLLVTHNPLLAGGWIAAQAAGGLLNLALKQTFERTRPQFADAALAASSWSFPSGHAMGTFILLGLGCYVFAREARSWTAAAALVTVSLSWCIVMAFSRLYLGVHFASDVIAGVIAGAAWVAVCASAFEMVRRRSSLDPANTSGS
jgi:membrane-associated phospholipid phosphatase